MEEEKRIGKEVKNVSDEGYKRYMTVSVTVLRGRNISVSFLHDLVDVPDPKVHLRCNHAIGRAQFRTSVAQNQINPCWNETFTFTLLETCQQAEIQIDLYEKDHYQLDPHLGSSIVRTNELEFNESTPLTFDYGKHGELDVEVLKKWGSVPHFRDLRRLSREEINLFVASDAETKLATEVQLKNEIDDTLHCMSVTVNVLRGRNISVGYLHDWVDVPDPQVYIKCENAVGCKQFKTKVAKNQVNPDWNETFVFVLQENVENSTVEVDLYEEDGCKFDPHLGSSTVKIACLPTDKSELFTFNYGKHGELTVEFTKRWRTVPNFCRTEHISEDDIHLRVSRYLENKVAGEEIQRKKSKTQIQREEINLTADDHAWIQKEREFQQKFNDKQVPYTPCMTVSVCVLGGSNISVNVLHDLVDVPDPQVYVRCDDAVTRTHFKTKIAKNQVNPTWNETFTFLLPENTQNAAVRIDLYEEDKFKHDPHLGSSTVNTEDLELGKSKTFNFDYGKHGELQVRMTKRWRTSPDFRLSHGLCNDEINYRISRKPKTKVAIEQFLASRSAPKNLNEVEVLAFIVIGAG